jgi:hypothetical protein
MPTIYDDDLQSTTPQSTYLSMSTISDDDLRSTTTQSSYLSTPTMSDDDFMTILISSEFTASIISSNVDVRTMSNTSTRYYMLSVTSSFEDMSVTSGTTMMTGNDVSTLTSDINIISSSVFEGTSSILPTSDTTTSFAVGKL